MSGVMTAAHRFSPLAALSGHGRFKLMLLLSLALHLTVIVGVRFKAPEWKSHKDNNTLEVVLVNSKSAKKPHKADVLAQANLDGGGNTDAKRRAKSPLPVLEREQTHTDLGEKDAQVKHMEQAAQALLTQLKSKAIVEQLAETSPAQDKQAQPLDATDLRQRSLDAARLEAQISRDWDKYQERPKRKFVGARAQEYRLARYVEDWRIKVERVGNLNYPEEARRHKIYGSLALTVSIRANGEVESVEVSRPSGHKALDEAAVRIVRLAAPYSPFPADIRRDTDIVSITRTWTFARGDQLSTEN